MQLTKPGKATHLSLSAVRRRLDKLIMLSRQFIQKIVFQYKAAVSGRDGFRSYRSGRYMSTWPLQVNFWIFFVYNSLYNNIIVVVLIWFAVWILQVSNSWTRCKFCPLVNLQWQGFSGRWQYFQTKLMKCVRGWKEQVHKLRSMVSFLVYQNFDPRALWNSNQITLTASAFGWAIHLVLLYLLDSWSRGLSRDEEWVLWTGMFHFLEERIGLDWTLSCEG